MKKAWKWIVGIIVGLVGACFLGVLGLGLVGMVGRMMTGSMAWGSQMHRGYGQTPNEYGPGFGMHGFGYMPMAGIGGLVAFGFFILLIIGVGLGIFALVMSLKKTQPAQAVTASVPVQSAPAATCKHCGKTVEGGWVACPYCGEKL